MKTASLNGQVYEVKSTGIKQKTVNSHYDFNGYFIEGHIEKTETFALFDKSGKQIYNLGGHQGREVFSSSNQKFGMVSVADSDSWEEAEQRVVNNRKTKELRKMKK